MTSFGGGQVVPQVTRNICAHAWRRYAQKCLAVVVLAGATILFLTSLAGCIVLPIPAKEESVVFGRALTESDMQQLTADARSLEDIKGRLGEPVINFGPQKIFVYMWTINKGRFFWAAGEGLVATGGDIPWTKSYLFIVAFNSDREVLKSGVINLSPLTSISEEVRSWVSSNGLAPQASGPQPGNSAHERPRIFVYRPMDSSCKFPLSEARIFKPAVSVDGLIVGDLAKGQYLASEIDLGIHEVVIDPIPSYRLGISRLSIPSIVSHSLRRVDISTNSSADAYIEISLCTGDGSIAIDAAIHDEATALPILKQLRPAW